MVIVTMAGNSMNLIDLFMQASVKVLFAFYSPPTHKPYRLQLQSGLHVLFVAIYIEWFSNHADVAGKTNFTHQSPGTRFMLQYYVIEHVAT